MKTFLAGLFGFGCVLAVALGQRCGAGDTATVTGITAGVVVAVMVAIAASAILYHRANSGADSAA